MNLVAVVLLLVAGAVLVAAGVIELAGLIVRAVREARAELEHERAIERRVWAEAQEQSLARLRGQRGNEP